MQVTLEWADAEQSLVHIRLVGHLSREALRETHSQLHALLSQVDHPVDLIFDPREQVFFPPRLGETIQEKHQIRLPNLRLVVFVGKTLIWEMYVLQAQRFPEMQYRLALVDTLEEAREMVRRFRTVSGIEAQEPGAPDWN